MIETILKNVQEHLSKLPFLKYIGEDWGQLDQISDRPPVLFPCALIDLDSADYSQIGKSVQTCNGTLSIRFATLPVKNISHLAPNREEPFEIYTKISELNRAIHGIGSKDYSRMIRLNTTRVRRDDSIREWVITYQFSFTDNSTLRE